MIENFRSPIDSDVEAELLKEGNEWIRKYLSFDIGVNYSLSKDALSIEVVNANKFHAYLTRVDWSIDVKPDTLGKKYLLKDLREQQRRIDGYKQQAVGIYPELEKLLRETPIFPTFLSHFNAGAAPRENEGSYIKLNDGINAFPLYLNRKNSEAQVNAIDSKGFPPPLEIRSKDLIWKVLVGARECLGMRFPSSEISYFNTDIFKKSLVFSASGIQSNNWYGGELSARIVEPFIFFHELGHVVLGHTEFLRQFRSPESLFTSFNTYFETRQRFELEADIFAIDSLLRLIKYSEFDTLRHGIIELFILFSFGSIEIESFSPTVRRRLVGASDTNSHLEEITIEASKNNQKTHPHPIKRFYEIWKYLGENQPKQPENLVDFSRLSREEYLDLAVQLGENMYDAMPQEPHQSAEYVCESIVGYLSYILETFITIKE